MLSRIPIYTHLRFHQIGSAKYWENRYQSGENSGSGSYGRLASFKAEVLNSFVATKQISSVIEFGCGDGNQLSLANYPRYVGLDVSKHAVQRCATRFAQDPTKSFLHYSPEAFYDRAGVFRADAALSLDVLYHLVEEPVYERYLEHLCASARRYIVIYAADMNADEVEDSLAPHVYPRRFTASVKRLAPDFELVQVVECPFKASFAKCGPDHSPCSFYFFEKES